MPRQLQSTHAVIRDDRNGFMRRIVDDRQTPQRASTCRAIED